MRAWLLLPLLGALLAGCSGEPVDDDEDFQVTCPHWGQARSSVLYRGEPLFIYNESIAANVSMEKEETYGKGMEHNGSRPLDKFNLHFAHMVVQDGVVTGKAYAGGSSRQLQILDEAGRNATDELRFPPGEYRDFRHTVRLTASGDPPAADHLRIIWTFEPDQDDDDRTRSEAYTEYRVNFLYLHENCT